MSAVFQIAIFQMLFRLFSIDIVSAVFQILFQQFSRNCVSCFPDIVSAIFQTLCQLFSRYCFSNFPEIVSAVFQILFHLFYKCFLNIVLAVLRICKTIVTDIVSADLQMSAVYRCQLSTDVRCA